MESTGPTLVYTGVDSTKQESTGLDWWTGPGQTGQDWINMESTGFKGWHNGTFSLNSTKTTNTGEMALHWAGCEWTRLDWTGLDYISVEAIRFDSAQLPDSTRLD